jgi:2-methylcitrate dehydratase PrpD
MNGAQVMTDTDDGAITRALAGHVCGLTTAALPRPVRRRTAELVLDLWGIMLRARAEADSTPTVLRTLADLGLCPGPARAVGDDAGYTPYGAALLDGILAHSLDFDDTHAAGSIHPGAAVIPAALAAAQMPGADASAITAAIVGGYDVVCRLSLALGPSVHYGLGFHPSATCGVFGGAAAAGRVLGLDPGQMAAAFGLCGSQAAGSLQFLVNGAWNKRWQVGAAAANGLAAAVAARHGFVGAVAPIEGGRGFLHGYSRQADPTRLLEALGSRFDLMDTGVKPYPSCRYTHAAVDGLRALRDRHALAEGGVLRVRIGLPQTGLAITGLPAEAKRRPRSVVDGQFSMHFVAAVALLTGGFGWDDYARWLGDPRVLALCDRIEVVHDDRAEAVYPQRMAATVEIERADGSRVGIFVEVPSGEPENFPDIDGHKAKFHALAAPSLGAAAAGRLAEAVLAAPDTDRWADLYDLSCPGAGQRPAASAG